MKGAQVEEIYDLSKPFRGYVQCWDSKAKMLHINNLYIKHRDKQITHVCFWHGYEYFLELYSLVPKECWLPSHKWICLKFVLVTSFKQLIYYNKKDMYFWKDSGSYGFVKTNEYSYVQEVVQKTKTMY